jgi:ABC-2 type transport system permease protein
MLVALLYKTWIESRFRFFAGVLLITSLSAFFVLAHSWIINTWLHDRLAHPDWYEPPWLTRATGDYPFFLWHFLPDGFLQQLWSLCAVLLGVGGLRREHAEGAAAFTLSLPASRRALFFSRIAVGLSECAVLAIIPALLLPALSWMIGQPYSVSEGLIHQIRLLGGGWIVFAASAFLSSLLDSAHLPAFIGLASLAVLYLFIQPYLSGSNIPAWIQIVDLKHLMAGPEYSAQWLRQPWMRLAGATATGIAILLGAARTVERQDF